MASSPSQCVTFGRCPRQWWFQSVRKMYPPDNSSQAFGTALHAVCAWFLSGASPGRTGEPEGWRNGLSDDDATKVVRMAERAVEQRVLRWRPNLEVERAFSLACKAGTTNGKIDCLDVNGGEIEDHKTSSSDRWLKTADDLRKDLAMMTYAGYLLKRTATSDVKHDSIVLRHNQFVLSDGSVTFTEVRVTPDEVREFWAKEIIPSLLGQERTRPCECWQDVPGHDVNSEACQAFKGCAFAPICHDGVPIEGFSFEQPLGDLPF